MARQHGLSEQGQELLLLTMAMAQQTSSRPEAAPEITDPVVLDDVLRSHRLWASVSDRLPSPPLARWRSSQVWVSSARHLDVAPDEDTFRGSLDQRRTLVNSKPAGGVLYTSTVSPGAPSMWQLYLLAGFSASLFPPPHDVWHLVPRPQCQVSVVDSAADWLHLVSEHHVQSADGLLLPDWDGIAREHDAVHLSAHGLLATQGVRFFLGSSPVVPSYWDVEATVWLRWCFEEPAPWAGSEAAHGG